MRTYIWDQYIPRKLHKCLTVALVNIHEQTWMDTRYFFPGLTYHINVKRGLLTHYTKQLMLIFIYPHKYVAHKDPSPRLTILLQKNNTLVAIQKPESTDTMNPLTSMWIPVMTNFRVGKLTVSNQAKVCPAVRVTEAIYQPHYSSTARSCALSHAKLTMIRACTWHQPKFLNPPLMFSIETRFYQLYSAQISLDLND